MSYTRKVKCAIARCPQPRCRWRKVLFGVDNRELAERAITETLNHLRERGRARAGTRMRPLTHMGRSFPMQAVPTLSPKKRGAK